MHKSPTCARQPATCAIQPATCAIQPHTCAIQPATCAIQSHTCTIHPARDLRQTPPTPAPFSPKVYAKKNRQTPAMETRTPSTSRRRMRWW